MEYSLSEKLKRYSVYMSREWHPNRVNVFETLKSYSEEAENLEKRIEELNFVNSTLFVQNMQLGEENSKLLGYVRDLEAKVEKYNNFMNNLEKEMNDL